MGDSGGLGACPAHVLQPARAASPAPSMSQGGALALDWAHLRPPCRSTRCLSTASRWPGASWAACCSSPPMRWPSCRQAALPVAPGPARPCCQLRCLAVSHSLAAACAVLTYCRLSRCMRTCPVAPPTLRSPRRGLRPPAQHACYAHLPCPLQGLFGCIPWGMILTYLNDYLSQNKGLSVQGATAVGRGPGRLQRGQH